MCRRLAGTGMVPTYIRVYRMTEGERCFILLPFSETLVEYYHLPCISCTDSAIADNLAALLKKSEISTELGREMEDYKPHEDW